MLLIRSTLFAISQIITVILFSLMGLLLWPLPFTVRYQIISRWALLNLWLLEKICGIRYQVEGLNNMTNEPVVIMCKHQSAWETLALQAIFPPQVWVLKRELLWIPFFGWGLALLNPIAIDRSAGRKALNQIVTQGKQRLNAGIWVVIFPEGTRVPVGEMGRFGIGGTQLAVAANKAILPVAHNAGQRWPRHSFIKKPGLITLVIGEKVEVTNKTPAELNQHIYQWMSEQMIRLQDEPDKPAKSAVIEEK